MKKIEVTGSALLLSLALIACDQQTAVTPVASTEMQQVAEAEPAIITVYKTPTCGCCKGWISYLQEEGFKVTAIDMDTIEPIKTKFGLTEPALKSCHTAMVGGYVVEGHVPAGDIERLLKEKPQIVGITAPGMPLLSPGMNSREPKDYTVYSFNSSNKSAVFSKY